MADLARRALLAGTGSALLAPAVVRAHWLMPVRSVTPVADRLERRWRRGETIAGAFVVERPLRFPTPSHGRFYDARFDARLMFPKSCVFTSIIVNQPVFPAPQASPLGVAGSPARMMPGSFLLHFPKLPDALLPDVIEWRPDRG